MVIGNGLMAGAFKENYSNEDGVLIFASGVSHSKEKRVTEFDREEQLLLAHLRENPEKLFVYFSTCSIYDPEEKDSPYVLHKLAMEKLIQQKVSNFLIVRVSNVVGKTDNDSTIFNFLARRIRNEVQFNLWERAFRNIIDVEDVSKIVHHVILRGQRNDRILNVANSRSYPVVEIVKRMEAYFNRKGVYIMCDAGGFFEIDTEPIGAFYSELGIDFTDNYIERLLTKYFPLSVQ